MRYFCRIACFALLLLALLAGIGTSSEAVAQARFGEQIPSFFTEEQVYEEEDYADDEVIEPIGGEELIIFPTEGAFGRTVPVPDTPQEILITTEEQDAIVERVISEDAVEEEAPAPAFAPIVVEETPVIEAPPVVIVEEEITPEPEPVFTIVEETAPEEEVIVEEVTTPAPVETPVVADVVEEVTPAPEQEPVIAAEETIPEPKGEIITAVEEEATPEPEPVVAAVEEEAAPEPEEAPVVAVEEEAIPEEEPVVVAEEEPIPEPEEEVVAVVEEEPIPEPEIVVAVEEEAAPEPEEEIAVTVEEEAIIPEPKEEEPVVVAEEEVIIPEPKEEAVAVIEEETIPEEEPVVVVEEETLPEPEEEVVVEEVTIPEAEEELAAVEEEVAPEEEATPAPGRNLVNQLFSVFGQAFNRGDEAPVAPDAPAAPGEDVAAATEETVEEDAPAAPGAEVAEAVEEDDSFFAQIAVTDTEETDFGSEDIFVAIEIEEEVIPEELAVVEPEPEPEPEPVAPVSRSEPVFHEETGDLTELVLFSSASEVPEEELEQGSYDPASNDGFEVAGNFPAPNRTAARNRAPGSQFGTALGLGDLAGSGESNYPAKDAFGNNDPNPDPNNPPKGIFGTRGISLLGGASSDAPETLGGGSSVNPFLWRASLDVLSFMPLASADPLAGVVITDWHSNPESPEERFKVVAYILDGSLRVGALRVSVFRQERPADEWEDAVTDENVHVQLENAILNRARELHLAWIEDQEG